MKRHHSKRGSDNVCGRHTFSRRWKDYRKDAESGQIIPKYLDSEGLSTSYNVMEFTIENNSDTRRSVRHFCALHDLKIVVDSERDELLLTHYNRQTGKPKPALKAHLLTLEIGGPVAGLLALSERPYILEFGLIFSGARIARGRGDGNYSQSQEKAKRISTGQFLTELGVELRDKTDTAQGIKTGCEYTPIPEHSEREARIKAQADLVKVEKAKQKKADRLHNTGKQLAQLASIRNAVANPVNRKPKPGTSIFHWVRRFTAVDCNSMPEKLWILRAQPI